MKRLFDIVVSVVGLTLLVFPFAIIAMAVKLSSTGPVFYRQCRIGYGGQSFWLYKFRTMVALDVGPQVTAGGDPRITPVGGVLRRWKLDELPQLWNVLWGQMSLVGPRPERPEMLEQLRPMLPQIDRRHASRPGLTGMAQVYNGYSNDLRGTRRKLAYDLRYLRSRSMTGEIRLLLRTFTKLWDPSAM